MKRRNVLKDDEAVSPVIATILMVAITVVLAATLYMMLPGADDAGTPVSGNISADYDSAEGNVTITFSTMGTPSTADPADVEINFDGEQSFGDDYDLDDEWNLLNADGEIRSSSYLEFTHEFDEEPDDVTVFFDGYDGSLTADF